MRKEKEGSNPHITAAQLDVLRCLEGVAPKWFCWGPLHTNNRGEAKVPINPRTLGYGSGDDMETTGALGEALARIDGSDIEGVGLALKAADPRLVVLDLDHARDSDTGELCAIGREAVRRLNGCYVEASPSGKGLRAVVLGDGSGAGSKTKITTTEVGPDGELVGVETFCGGHASWVRMSGQLVDGGAAQVLDAPAGLLEWIASLDKRKAPTRLEAATPAGDVWDQLADYRGTDGKDVAEVLASINKAAKDRPSGAVAQAVGLLRRGEENSEEDLLLSSEAVRRGAGAADDVAAVLLTLAGPGVRAKLKDRRDYRDRTANNAAAAVLKDIEAGNVGALHRRTWLNLPGAAAGSVRVLDDVAVAAVAGVDAGAWILDGQGKRRDCTANALTALTTDPRTAGLFAFNLAVMRVERTRGMQDVHPTAAKGPGEVQDVDVSFIRVHLARAWGIRITADDTWEVIAMAARSAEYDPLIEALNRLPPWDGVHRCDSWLVDHLKVDATGIESYVREAGRCVLIGAVMRILHPGSKHDSVLCVEGLKGGGKSTSFEALSEALLPGSFTDQMPNITDPAKVIEATEGKIIVEISELSAFRKASDQESLKHTLSTRKDRVRRAFARTPVEVPRRFIFVATTNQDAYINDATGGLDRRFHTVKSLSSETSQIDIPRLRSEARQIWAEALHLYRCGALSYIEPGSAAYREWVPEREKRREVLPYAEEVEVALSLIVADEDRDKYDDRKGIRAVAMAELAGLDKEVWTRDRTMQGRFTEAMKSAGMVRGGRIRGATYWTVPEKLWQRVARQDYAKS